MEKLIGIRPYSDGKSPHEIAEEGLRHKSESMSSGEIGDDGKKGKEAPFPRDDKA